MVEGVVDLAEVEAEEFMCLLGRFRFIRVVA